MIPSDELGEKGESRFKEICADALLICNKSDRDRAGWDFIIEFPFEETNSTLDARATPISCHIQVKTISAKSTTAKVLLSAAERLAKEIKPTFIYIFRVNDDLTFANSYLLHIFDDRLAAILKRLRKEHANGEQGKINKKRISFTPLKAELLEANGSILRSALISKCQHGMHNYAELKKKQLQSLGFEKGKIRGELTFADLSEDEILDVFLGAKKEVPLANLTTFETRFGIEIPGISMTSGHVTLSPQAMNQCIITVRGDDLSPPAIFSADLFVASLPGLTDGRVKALHKTEIFSLLLNLNRDGKNSYNVTYDLQALPPQTISIWGNFWRMMSIFASGRGTIDVMRKGSQESVGLPIISVAGLPDVAYCISWMKYLSDIESLLKRAGAAAESKLTYDELIAAQSEVGALTCLFNSPAIPLSLSYQSSTRPLDVSTKERFIITRSLQLGNTSIAYYGVGKFSHISDTDRTTWRSDAFALKRVQAINSAWHYDQFIEMSKQTEGSSDILIIDKGHIQFDEDVRNDRAA